MNGEALLETRALASVSNIEILKLHFAGRPPNEIIEKTTAAFVGRAWRGRGVAGRAGLNNHTTWGAISENTTLCIDESGVVASCR